MPKTPNSPIRMYFIIQPSESNGSVNPGSECKACGLKMKGVHASNMERHVRRSHPQIYEKYLELKQKTFNPVKRNYEWVNNQAFAEFDMDFNPSDFIKIKKIKGTTGIKRGLPSSSNSQSTRQNIIDACVELVTVNGRPFSIINDSGFRALIQLAYGKAHPPLIINDDRIKDLVSLKALTLKSSIRHEVKHKMVCLKLDISTHCNRSFMGISVQCYSDGKVISFMLAVVEVNVRDETSELNGYIFSELEKFGVSKKQLYCVVYTNGSNFVDSAETDETESEAAGSGASVYLPRDASGLSQTVDVNPSNTYDASNLVSLGDDVEAAVITVFTDCDEDNDLDWSTTEMIIGKLLLDVTEETRADDQSGAFGAQEMRCIADTLQWAVNDAVKSCEEILDVIREARVVLQKLKSPSCHIVLKQNNLRAPSLNSTIRWRSVYSAFVKLMSLKDICVQLPIVFKTNFWDNLSIFLTSLKPCQSVHDILQKEQLTVGDVYKLWFNCILETSKIETVLAQSLVQHMRQKQDSLFEDDLFLASIFLDPRFNNMVLNEEHKTKAVEHLVLLYQKLSYDPSEDCDSHQINTNEEEDELEKIFREQEHFNDSHRDSSSSFKFIEIALRSFCDNEPRLKTTESVITFWEKKKTKYPEVYRLASVIFSVPATQKSTSKLLSQMQYALSSHVTHMDRDKVNDVILIRSNSEL